MKKICFFLVIVLIILSVILFSVENKNNLKVVNTEYLENIEIMIEMTEEHLKKITNSNSKNPLKIIKYDILKEKYIDI